MINQLVAGGENVVADNLSGRIANPILWRNLPERKIRTNGENYLIFAWIYNQRCRVGANILNKKPCN
jgi:hypothetical protein